MKSAVVEYATVTFQIFCAKPSAMSQVFSSVSGAGLTLNLLLGARTVRADLQKGPRGPHAPSVF